MAQGCISVIEMTVSACTADQLPGLGVMLEGKKLPRLDVSKSGQGFVAVDLINHREDILCLRCRGSDMILAGVGKTNCLEILSAQIEWLD